MQFHLLQGTLTNIETVLWFRKTKSVKWVQWWHWMEFRVLNYKFRHDANSSVKQVCVKWRSAVCEWGYNRKTVSVLCQEFAEVNETCRAWIKFTTDSCVEDSVEMLPDEMLQILVSASSPVKMIGWRGTYSAVIFSTGYLLLDEIVFSTEAAFHLPGNLSTTLS
jgi:hypothetical protein